MNAILDETEFQVFDMHPAIAGAVNAIMAAIKGVEKAGRNVDQKYDYTRVEDLLAKVQPEMVASGLFIIPSEIGHGPFGDSGLMTATYSFRLAHKSGAVWSDPMRYSGMATYRYKSGGFDDKALNKCGTAARKYFLLALFQIPTGLADADHDEKRQGPRKSAAQAKRDGDHEVILAEIEACKTESDLNLWYEKFDARMSSLPVSWKDPMRDKVEVRRNAILDEGAFR